jgi:Ca-activated chloride channel family protein
MYLGHFQHFHFLRPYWFVIFLVVLYILRAFTLRDDSLAQWRELMSPAIVEQLTVSGNNNHWLSPKNMSIIIAIPLCLLLMGPTWQQQPSPFSENNAPLIIALDVSTTMEQSDVQPSRLLRAKQKIIELLELRGDSKTALVAYAGSAHVVMPITNDREMIRLFLDSLSEKVMPVPGKLPETILPLAKTLLNTSSVPGTVLMVGDGATSNTVDAFSHFFAVQSSQLVIWAIGVSPELLDTNTGIDNDIIPLQLTQLQNLSKESNGRLVLMSNDKSDINHVNQHIEHNLVIVDDNSRPWHDAGYYLTFVIALIFLSWFRKGWTLQW